MNTLNRISRAVTSVTLILICTSFVANDSQAEKQATSTAPRRGYYLTKDFFDGSQPLNACATGYHMASLWEIHEPSNLRYDESLWYTQGDGGPPTEKAGWIRLGLEDIYADAFFCSDIYSPAWSSNHSLLKGAVAYLVHPYLELTEFSVVERSWSTSRQSCNNTYRVWCVQD